MINEDVAKHVMRLNMRNKHHVELHKILEGLDRKISKSKSSFLIDAVDFYIENAGKALSRYSDNKYLTWADLDKIKEEVKKDVVDPAVNEARNEAIKLFVASVAGMRQETVSLALPTATNRQTAAQQEDDSAVVESALKWFKGE
jgi:hypothetical protein